MPVVQKDQKLNVPVINISALVQPNSSPESIKETVQQIGTACREWGFFYIVEHGVEPEFIEKVQALSREFFRKPKEFKRTVARTANNFRGFSDQEFTKQKVDWKEVYDFTSDQVDLNERTLDIDGENRWPVGMEEFKTHINRYFEETLFISGKLMAAIFASLGVEPERFAKDFAGCRDTSGLRVNYYPICPDSGAHLGVGPHSDPSALTILWQDQDVSSLQVEKDGVFYDVYPVPNSFVINIGDMTQVWSNGLYKAPVHRVLANHHNERFSAPLFYCPSYACMVKPLETCVSEKNPAKYRPINWGEFRKARYEGDYADVGVEVQIAHYEISRGITNIQ